MLTSPTEPLSGRSRSANALNDRPAPPTPFYIFAQPAAPSHPTFGFARPPQTLAAVLLSFEVKAETRWGDTVVLVGSTESFGG